MGPDQHRPGKPDLEALDAAATQWRRFPQLPTVHRFLRAQLDSQVDPGAYRVLRAVERTERAAPTVGDIAEALDVDASTASRLIDRAVSEQLIERRPDEHDRRRTHVHLTEQGVARLGELREARLSLWRALTDDWPREDVVALAALLERTYEAARGLQA
ncbi:MAG TPA: MarR family winged helix-turn-helix transcriptional regulator [Nitriliruptorales bacterium]